MLLRYIGENITMGLNKNKICDCLIFTADGYFWVSWVDHGGGDSACPYKSFKEIFEDWEEVGE